MIEWYNYFTEYEPVLASLRCNREIRNKDMSDHVVLCVKQMSDKRISMMCDERNSILVGWPTRILLYKTTERSYGKSTKTFIWQGQGKQEYGSTNGKWTLTPTSPCNILQRAFMKILIESRLGEVIYIYTPYCLASFSNKHKALS